VTEPINWGILATGGIATRFAADLAHVPGARLAAVGSRSEGSARAFAQAQQHVHGGVRAHGSWESLAADPDVDVIYVATPHSHHFPAGLLCLRAGKAMLVEKPFTLDLGQAADLVSVARESGLFLMEAMWTRTLPAVVKLRELVADGAIGEVTSVHAQFASYSEFPPEHRMRDRALGGGALLDIGVYPVAFAQLFLGEASQVRAWAALHPEGTDANTGIVLGFDSGAIATLHCGVRGTTWSATVVGTKGRVELASVFDPRTFILHRDGVDAQVFDAPIVGSGLNYQAVEVVRCLRAGLTESPLVPLRDTLATMRTLDAIRSQIGVHY
jgi:predicted dehydrogenase